MNNLADLSAPEGAAPLKNVAPGNAASEADVARVKCELIRCAQAVMFALDQLERREGPWLYRAREDAAQAQQAMGRARATLGKNDS